MRSFESLDAKEKGMLAASSAMEYLKMNQDDSIRYPRPTVPTRTAGMKSPFVGGCARPQPACTHERRRGACSCVDVATHTKLTVRPRT